LEARTAVAALQHSLDQLGFDYVDLYLIHWPVPSRDLYTETWRALTELAADGRARAIGVSNFQIPHLERIIEETGVIPAVNQIELHPRSSSSSCAASIRKHGILTEAWSPLGQGGAGRTSTCSTSSSGVNAWPRSPSSIRASGSGPTRTRWPSPSSALLGWSLGLGVVMQRQSVEVD